MNHKKEIEDIINLEPKTTQFDYIPEKEALKLLNISRTTLWRLREGGFVKCYKIEGTKRTYYKLSEIINAFVAVV
jgi:hypothetical protein